MPKDIKKYKEGDILEIIWDDYEENPAWTPIDIVKFSNPPKCKSIGYFINEDDNCIRICGSISEDGMVGFVLIPKSMIRKINKVAESKLDDLG